MNYIRMVKNQNLLSRAFNGNKVFIFFNFKMLYRNDCAGKC